MPKKQHPKTKSFSSLPPPTAAPMVKIKPKMEEKPAVVVEDSSPKMVASLKPPAYFPVTFFLCVALITAYANMASCVRMIRHFRRTLSEEQNAQYAEIENFRRKITVQGIVAGVVVLIVYLLFDFLTGYWKHEGLFLTICNGLFILLATPWIWYMASPKSMHFLKDVVTDLEQVTEWYNIYQCFESKCYGGLVLGFIISFAVFLVAYIIQLLMTK